jgi:hypothetical protein
MVVTSDEVGDFGDSQYSQANQYKDENDWGIVFEIDGESISGLKGFFSEGKGNKSDPHLILVNGGQSEDNKVKNLSHEAYGHGYFFQQELNHEHINSKEYPVDSNGNITGPETTVDKNRALDDHINKVVGNTQKFIEQRRGK